jgi:hypothetical protein
VSESILTSIKKALGIVEANTAFDAEIVMYINGVFPTLFQLGVGSDSGFAITNDEDTWDDFLGSDLLLNSVKTYMALNIRLLLDPPATSFGIDAVRKMIEEAAWRINTYKEETIWVDPTIVVEV